MKLAISLMVIGGLGLCFYIVAAITGNTGNVYAGMVLFWFGIVPLGVGLWRFRRLKEREKIRRKFESEHRQIDIGALKNVMTKKENEE